LGSAKMGVNHYQSSPDEARSALALRAGRVVDRPPGFTAILNRRGKLRRVRCHIIAGPLSALDRCWRSETASMTDQAGPVEKAVRSAIREGERLPTPTGRAEFVVEVINGRGVVLLFGQKRTPTPIGWDCLEGAAEFLRGRGWIPIGANRVLSGNPGTLDEYMKAHVQRQTANYVAALLERAGVVELSRGWPAQVRLAAGA
jgi:hypothetical protein